MKKVLIFILACWLSGSVSYALDAPQPADTAGQSDQPSALMTPVVVPALPRPAPVPRKAKTSKARARAKAPAKEVSTSPGQTGSPDGHWVFQLQGEVPIPVSDEAANVWGLGYGGEIMVGYAFSPGFTLGLESGYSSLSGKTVNESFYDYYLGYTMFTVQYPSLNHIPVELVAQYKIDADGPVKPYFTWGLGVAFDFASGDEIITTNGQSTTYPSNGTVDKNIEAEPGFGIMFPAGENADFFVQTKFAIDFGPGTIVLLPIQFGLNCPL